jgi:hypothetical protein
LFGPLAGKHAHDDQRAAANTPPTEVFAPEKYGK